MTPEYKATRKRLKRLIAAWGPLMDLAGHTVEHRFHEVFFDPENMDSTVAVTKSLWEYRDHVIHWYLPVACRCTDADLENSVVHEYVHVLLNPIREFVPEAMDARNELATENVARALLKVRSSLPHP